MTRPLRPLVLAGYAGALLALVGAQLGGLDVDASAASWRRSLLAFLLKGVADDAPVRRRSRSATTVLGVAGSALGLGHLVLLRDIPEHGRLALFTVLLAVFAADTVAYFAGRLLGRHKLAPTISPGKTWEGFVGGTIAAIARHVLRALRGPRRVPRDLAGGRARARDRGRRRRSATCSSRCSSATWA